MPESPTTNAEGVVSLTLLSSGREIDDGIEILSVQVRKEINKVAAATLVLVDGDMPQQDFPLSNTDTFEPGAEVEVRAGYANDTETLFKGIVVRHQIKIDGNNFARLVVECRDKAVAMTVGRKNANYVDAKDGEVISKLISSYSGLTASVDSTSAQHGELVQYYCTDWDFMLARAEASGLLVLVDDGKVTVQTPRGDTAASLQVTYGTDLIEFDAAVDARTQLQQVRAVSWDQTTQDVVEQSANATSVTQQGNLQSAQLASVIGLASYRLQTNAPMKADFLESWAGSRQLKAGLARIRGRMRFQGNAKPKIGGVIALAGVGDRFSGNVFVSSVRHDLAGGSWVTELGFGLPEEWYAEQHQLMAPPAGALVPGVQGLQIGVVNKLDEDPDGNHRVQVTIPLLQAETEGVWARLASFYGSDGIGAFFVPEVGDEVVLGYLNSDPAHPVILGALYSSKRTPPYGLSKENNIKAVVTRSGLKIEFDDDNKIVTIVTPNSNQIVLSDDGKSILLRDQNGNKIELDEGGILMSSPKDIAIEATGKLSLQANGDIAVQSQSDVGVKGLNINSSAEAGLTAQGSASAELSSSGQTTVKGSVVIIN